MAQQEQASGWDNFGQTGSKTRWFSALNMLVPKNYNGQGIELRIVTSNPYWIATHWYYKDVQDAWLFKNDREGLKAKYSGDARKAVSFSAECPDVDHATGRSSLSSCEHCTTYFEYQPYPNRVALVQAFWRIPKSKDLSLSNWSKDLIVVSMANSQSKGLGRIINTQGTNIADVRTGYSVLMTYNKGQGASTWTMDYLRPTPLTREQWEVVKAQRINFDEVYEPSNKAEIDQELVRHKYYLLTDGTLDRTGGVLAGNPVRGTSAPAAGRTPIRPGRAAPVAPADDFVVEEDYGTEPPLPGDEFTDGELAPEGDFADELPPDDGFDGGYEEPPVPSRPVARPAVRPQAVRPVAPRSAPTRPTAPPAGRPVVPGARRPNTPPAPRR
jgi:hypothetical protein